MQSPKLRAVDPLAPQADIIQQAVRVIAAGGVVVFPTRNLYGLGADAFNAAAVDKIFKIKRRPESMPLLVLIKNRDELDRVVRTVPPVAQHLMDCFWPGGLTIVFEAKEGISPSLTAGTGKIGVRLPAHPVAAALVKACLNPITGTSANISGNGGCSDIADLERPIRDSVDLILDAGPLQPGIGSSVIDVTVEPVRLLREGAVSARNLHETLGRY